MRMLYKTSLDDRGMVNVVVCFGFSFVIFCAILGLVE
jgi:hypothetical protein